MPQEVKDNVISGTQDPIWGHSGEDITLKEFLLKIIDIPEQHLKEISVSVQKVFEHRDNQDQILKRYSDEDKKANNNKANINLIKSGTKLRIPKDFIRQASEIHKLKVQPLVPFEKYTTFSAFLGNKMKALVNDEEKYFPSLRVNENGSLLQKKVLRLSIYLYSRVLDKLINISAFVTDCQTNVADSGGNFSFNLSPITAHYDTAGNLVSLESHPLVKKFEDKGVQNYYFKHVMSRDGVVRQNPQVDPIPRRPRERNNFVNKDKGDGTTRARNQLYWNVAIQPQDMVFIKYENLAFENDEGTRITDPFSEISMKDVNNGIWDMMGLVDNVSETYSPPTGQSTITIGGRDFSKLILEDGAYFFPFSTQEKSYASNFFGNRDAIKDERSFVRLLGEIQDINLFINKPISYTMSFIFNKLSTIEVFDNKVFDPVEPDDTIDIRKYFTYLNSIPSNLEKNKKSKEAAAQDSKSVDNRVGVWKMIELVVDDLVRNKTIVDSSIATNSGSIMNFIGRICQNPFIEFFTDTYNDRFYWIVRKPPFTKEAFLSNTTIDIEDASVLNTSLQQNDDQAYSWYRLVPIRAYWGDEDFAKFAFPAQFFPEFAKMFGSQPLEITSQYVEFGSGLDKEVQNAFFGATEELRFIIESNAYLPFTRKGTITIQGDRRIKKGMNVYLETTGEMFYVDSVSNTYNVNSASTDRTTTLAVSRGVVYAHIEKYFDLITYSQPTAQGAKERKLNYKVNTDYFDFLVKKKQFNEA